MKKTIWIAYAYQPQHYDIKEVEFGSEDHAYAAFSGTEKECQQYAARHTVEYCTPHYPNAPEGSIWDY